MAEATTRKEKISQALQELDQAAREKGDELKEMLTDKYASLKQTVVQAGETGLAKTKEAAAAVDDNVRRNPWYYIGGAAVGGLLLGYILGKKS